MPRLVERQRGLDELKKSYIECSHGTGGVVLVSGFAGSGKTALLSAFNKYAAGEGALMLDATGSRAERDLGFGVMSQLVRGLDGHEAAESLMDLLNNAMEAGLTDGLDRTVYEHNLVSVIHRMSALLLELSQTQPIVISIDDAHFIDEPSLRCLLYLRRRLAPVGALLVLGQTAELNPSVSLIHPELADQPGYRWIRLTSLSRTGVAEALAQHTRPDVGERLADLYHRVSGGNPRLVSALIEDHLAAGGTEQVIGLSYQHAVLMCLYRLDSRVIDVACGVAGPRRQCHGVPARAAVAAHRGRRRAGAGADGRDRCAGAGPVPAPGRPRRGAGYVVPGAPGPAGTAGGATPARRRCARGHGRRSPAGDRGCSGAVGRGCVAGRRRADLGRRHGRQGGDLPEARAAGERRGRGQREAAGEAGPRGMAAQPVGGGAAHRAVDGRRPRRTAQHPGHHRADQVPAVVRRDRQAVVRDARVPGP